MERRIVTAKRASGPIVLDGRMDEGAWKEAEVVEGFHTWNKGEKEPNAARIPATSATRVRVLHDGKFLYVGAEMEDRDIYAVLTEHNAATWHDDVFEIFVKPDPAKHHFYEFHVTPLNTNLELFFPRRGIGALARFYFDSGMKSAVTVDGTINHWEDVDRGWTAEVAIPLSAFAKTVPAPGPGTQWRVAFCRYDYSYHLPDSYFSGVELSSSAALSYANFHLHEEYDILRFE